MLKKFLSTFIALSLLIVGVTACTNGGGTGNVGGGQTGGPEDQLAAPVTGDIIATMRTSMGDIQIKMLPQFAPLTVENFVGLAEQGLYDGVSFHRVIEGFMIQGGDFTNHNGTGGRSIWGSDFNDEFSPYARNIRGSLSMANRGPNTNGSQFFINQVNNNFLDDLHSVFGQVIEGMDVVDAIAASTTDPQDRPLPPVIIETITISTH